MGISDANDAMIRRLESELKERNQAQLGLTANANDAGRDLNDAEKETLAGIQLRMGQIKEQLDILDATSKAAAETGERLKQIDVAVTQSRKVSAREVEYRSAGAFIVDSLAAHLGDRTAVDRLEVFARQAAHQVTADNPGVIPDPVVGNVLNFIDGSRPLVNLLGVQSLPSGTFYRPKITQNTSVTRQGGDSTDETEKTELASQKMLISRLTVNADTYGGYVNVSRQNIDWSSPQIFDIIVNDLATQYAIATENVVCDAVEAVGTAAVLYPLASGANFTEFKVKKALWAAAADVWAAVKGQGRIILALAPDRLEAFGPLFDPNINPASGGAGGMAAANFAQGIAGSISGIPVVMSAGFTSGFAAVLSTAALEVWEQRIGTLSVVEPSVLGVQVAYAGHFATLTTASGGIVPFDEDTA